MWSLSAGEQCFEVVIDRRHPPAWFFFERMRYVMRAIDGVVFTDEDDGQVVLVALVPAFEDLVLRHRDGCRAFDTAFDLDVAGFWQPAILGGGIRGDVPSAFLSGDVDHATTAGFFGLCLLYTSDAADE